MYLRARRGRRDQARHPERVSPTGFVVQSSGPTTTRRQLIHGVAGAGIVSLLVPTTGWADATAEGSESATVDSDGRSLFWLGTQEGESLSLTALDPGGRVVVSGLSVPLVTVRSVDGSSIVSLDIDGSGGAAAHRLVVRSAATGSIVNSGVGQRGAVRSDPNVVGHDLELRLGADGRYAAVLDTAWSIAGQHVVAKQVPEAAGSQAITAEDAVSATSIEVFDLDTVAAVGHQHLADGAIGPACGFAAGAVVATWSESGQTPPVRGLGQTPPVRAVGQAVRSMNTGPLPPIDSDGLEPVGAAYALSTPGGLWARAIGFGDLEFVSSGLQPGSTQLFPVDWGAAKPFGTRLISISDTLLLAVNAGIPAAAVIDGRDGTLVDSTLLASESAAAPGPLSQWAADASSQRLYMADSATGQGGLWVYDLPSLRLVDRWLSTTAFSAVRVSPDESMLYALGRDSSLAFAITPQGAVVSATELPGEPTAIY